MEKPTSDYFITNFKRCNENLIICSLNNGQFLVWDISQDNFTEVFGHQMGVCLNTIYQHNQFIITGDQSGIIQIRDLNNQFSKVGETNIIPQNN